MGLRGYLAVRQLLLAGHDAVNVSGGFKSFKVCVFFLSFFRFFSFCLRDACVLLYRCHAPTASAACLLPTESRGDPPHFLDPQDFHAAHLGVPDAAKL